MSPPSLAIRQSTIVLRAVLLALSLVTLAAPVRAQVEGAAAASASTASTTVVGRVVDAATFTPVDDVRVVLKWPRGEDGSEGRQEVRSTNAEGAFDFGTIPPGRYNVEYSREGYRSSTMTDFDVRSGEANRADFPLPALAAAAAGAGAAGAAGAADSAPLEEFVVKADKVEDLMSVRLESDQLLNVVGAEEFSKFAAGDVAEVLERVAGVNVVEGQFAIIRGLEDRYSSTLLNGAPIPSPDPDSQSVQLDLFPSEIVGNLSVQKSFSPELPSNSSGGAINIITQDYPADIEVGLKAGTGYNQYAQDRFLELKGHTDVDRVIDGLSSTVIDGVRTYPDIRALKANGFRFVGGNPVGEEAAKDGGFFEDVDDVLKSDYVGTLAGTKEFGGRQFRFKGVISQETEYKTAEGFEEARDPRGPEFGDPTFVFIPDPPFVITVPGQIERSGDLSLGELGRSNGKYDLTISQKEKQTTGYAGGGFDLDDEGNHKVDVSYLYTKVQKDAVELQSGGFLPDFDYATVSQQQLADDIDPEVFKGVVPGSFIGGSIRGAAFGGPSLGALAFSTFNESTSFETDRDLWVLQGNGDHTFAPIPGLHFSWAVNEAKTTQNESAIGMGYFYEPCGFSPLVPCAPGTSAIEVPNVFPTTVDDLGPGKYAVRNDLLLSANRIEERAHFYRLDADYAIDFSEAAKFKIAGGTWFERANRTVDSVFLEGPTVTPGEPSQTCFAGATTNFACLDDTSLGLGGAVFNDLTFADGNLAGMRRTTNEASRKIDAWNLQGKFTLWDKLDLLGGVRSEHILITSKNDPFRIDPVTGELVTNLGGPTTFPPRFLFFDRLDNPFLRALPSGGSVQETTTPPPPGFVFNDELLGTGVTPGPCLGDDGSRPGIQCVDLVERSQLEPLFNGEIDEHPLLPSAGFTLRPIEGLYLRGAWGKTVARPSFRELGYYVTVAPGTNDLVVGNPQLELSNVESWDARAEYLFGERGDLIAISYFKKRIETPIESIIIRDPLNVELGGSLYQTFFNNPNTAHLWGIEAEARKSFDFLPKLFPSAVPDWLKYLSIGGNYTYIDAEVGRTDAELARTVGFFGVAPGDQALYTEVAPTRRLFNQPKWIANADLTFDHPDWGLKATLAYFAISDVLDAAGTATLGPTGDVLAFTLDRYVDSFSELRATVSKTFELPSGLGEMTLRFTGKNLTNSKRRLIYDTLQTNTEIAQQQLKVGRDYGISISFKRAF